MKIDSFKIIVDPEQSKIVQEIIFKNGYSWVSGSIKVHNIDYNCLFFYNGFRKNRDIGLTYSDDINTSEDLQLITFEEFIDNYGIKGERRNKLNKLSKSNE